METLKRYWRRKDYERLDGPDRLHKKNRVGVGLNRRKRFWRIKISPKLRLRSPKKLLIGLRDAYMRMMMGFTRGFTYAAGGVGGKAMGFGGPALKEYDEKVIVEIYKSLMVQQQLMGRRDGDGNVVCRR